jgi:hypothetical protein
MWPSVFQLDAESPMSGRAGRALRSYGRRPGVSSTALTFTRLRVRAESMNGLRGGNAPYDAKHIGDYTGLTPHLETAK